jgi:adenine/guanine phosphoribosyltransferase-like PRPP-binding protein
VKPALDNALADAIRTIPDYPRPGILFATSPRF